MKPATAGRSRAGSLDTEWIKLIQVDKARMAHSTERSRHGHV